MYRTILIVFVFIITGQISAQKIVQQSIEADAIQRIVIESDEVFEIKISTSPTKKINVETQSEGEYAQAIAIQSEIQEGQLLLSSAFEEILSSGYDKLSAHKVFAVTLNLQIPKGMRVIINSNLASVFAEGNYSFFEAELKSGRCELKKFSGKAIINTFSGDIFISTKRAKITANSNHGEVNIEENIPFGKEIRIKTVNGDINVQKIE